MAEMVDEGMAEVPARADVVVVGGGVAGTSLAYQLSKRGKDVVLVEMRGICSGASGRNAGHTGSGRSATPGAVGEAIHALTSENFRMVSKELPAELGDDFDLRVVGAVDIAQNEEQAEYLQQSTQTLALLDPDVRWLDGPQLREMVPVAGEHLLGAQYSPHSGHIWPFKLVHGLANGARRYGATICPWTRVEQIVIEGGAIAAVETSRGRIETDTVVMATNAWTPQLLPDLPEGALVPARGQILVTQPLPPVLSTTFGTNYGKEYGRQTATGQLICGGFRRYDHDEGLGHYTEEAVAEAQRGCARCLETLFPPLAGAKVVRGWAGTMGFTADGLPLIGPTAMADGMYLSAGYNGGGFSWNLAVGKALAGLIVNGQTAYDLAPFDPDRFAREGVEWRNPSTAGEKNNPRSMQELRGPADI